MYTKTNYLKKLIELLLLFVFLVQPHITYAQFTTSGDGGELGVLLINILIFINNTLIPFIIGIGFVFFVWGIFLFFILGGADEEKRAKGKSFVINATIGFVMIIIFFGIINLITSSTGLEGETIKSVPSVKVPSL